MRKLVIKGSAPLKEFPLGSGITIGSLPGNTVQISNSKADGEHARIYQAGDNVFVEDLNSRVGLTLNGKKVSRAALKPNDAVEICGTTLIYMVDDRPEPSAAKAGGNQSTVPVGPQAKPSGSMSRMPVPKGAGGPAAAGKPIAAVPAPGPASSSRMSAAASSSRKAPVVDEAMQSASKLALDALKKRTAEQAQARSVGDGGGRGGVVAAVAVVLAIAIAGGAAIYLGSSGGAEVATDAERMAIERLKQKGPKTPNDLEFVRDKLMRCKEWDDITQILGEPDVRQKDRFPLYTPALGTYDVYCEEFCAYFIKGDDWTDDAESPIRNVLLFSKSHAATSITFVGSSRYSVKQLPPQKTPVIPTETAALPEASPDGPPLPMPPIMNDPEIEALPQPTIGALPDMPPEESKSAKPAVEQKPDL